MKKILAMAITILVIGMAAAPLVQAQDMAKIQQLSDEANRIDAAAEARGGNFTPQELQRMQQIADEINQLLTGVAVPAQPYNPQQEQDTQQMYNLLEQQNQQALQRQQQSQQQQTQQTNNWPSNALLNKYGIGSITQPSGTLASFEERTGERGLLIRLENATEDHCGSTINQIAKIRGIQRDGTSLKTYEKFLLNKWTIIVDYDRNEGYFTINIYDISNSPDKG